MLVQIIIAGLVLGGISSFHCVGMCGPLALALPVQHLNRFHKSISLLLYHLGRIGVYAGFGLVFGLAGRGLYVAGFQQWFSIGLGLFMIFYLIWYFTLNYYPQPVILQKIYGKIQHQMIRLWKQPSDNRFLFLGMANGLLPCGMVYLAIAGALNTTRVQSGVLFMVFFGLGTLPPLFALSYFGSMLKISFRNKIRQLTPFIIGLMALLLILRGLNLGIPYISPILGAARGPAIICH